MTSMTHIFRIVEAEKGQGQGKNEGEGEEETMETLPFPLLTIQPQQGKVNALRSSKS